MQTATFFRNLLVGIASLAFAAGLCAAENPKSNIALDAALVDAQALVGQRSDMKVLRVEGNSMLPYFGSGAVLVVKTGTSASLKPGMLVVYTNRFNETVAHRIVGAVERGWQVQGYNNTQVDSTPVSDTNLVGVVYATFHSNARLGMGLMASVSTGIPVALAAPAR